MKRFIIPIFDILLAVYLVFAVTSFNNPKETNPVCTNVSIVIADENTFGFLNAEEVKKLLQKKGLYPLQQKMKDVNLRNIEETLCRTAFVRTAECCKTTDGKVIITITQRSPILRIKNERGEDYYIDENGGVMPNSSYTSDLIIATGNISRKFAHDYLSILANFIMSSELWSNQIEQINILQDKGVELVPRVGDHIIFLGYLPENSDAATRREEIETYVSNQLHRLDQFYRYGLSKAGWNRYEHIDLQFENQIVCRKQGAEMARLEAERRAYEAALNAPEAPRDTTNQASQAH